MQFHRAARGSSEAMQEALQGMGCKAFALEAMMRAGLPSASAK